MRRLALGTAALALVWLFGVWPPPLWWRDHSPRETAMMRLRAERRSDGTAVGKLTPTTVPPLRPIPLEQISPSLQRMVIIGEDSRFRTHHGIDPAEIADALELDGHAGTWEKMKTIWRRRDRLRGASTITQQLAKNLYLSPSRNPLRKVKEAVTALRFELALSKDRILELYLNVVEWGPGIWGADAASRVYFGVPATRLGEAQAAALAATLPHPLTSNPKFRPEHMAARRNLILARYHGADVEVPPEEEGDSVPVPVITLPPVPPVTDTPIDSVGTEGPAESVQDTTTAELIHQP